MNVGGASSGSGFEQIKTKATNNVNTKINVEKNQSTKNFEQAPSLDLNSKLNLNNSKVSSKEFKNQIQFVVPSNNQSSSVKLLGGIAKDIDLDRGSKEVLAQKILTMLKKLESE